MRKKDYQVVGPADGKSFTLRFLGVPGAAAKRAGKFLGLQKLEGGGWRDLQVRSKDGGQNRLFADADKNGKQIRREALTKKLVRVLKTTHPDVEFFGRKSDGAVTSNYIAIARINIIDADNYKVEWNGVAADKLGINRSQIATKLLAEDVRAEPDWV